MTVEIIKSAKENTKAFQKRFPAQFQVGDAVTVIRHDKLCDDYIGFSGIVEEVVETHGGGRTWANGCDYVSTGQNGWSYYVKFDQREYETRKRTNTNLCEGLGLAEEMIQFYS